MPDPRVDETAPQTDLVSRMAAQPNGDHASLRKLSKIERYRWGEPDSSSYWLSA